MRLESKLGQNSSRRGIVVCVSSSEPKKMSVVEGKMDQGSSCFEGIPLPPMRAIKPVTQVRFSFSNRVQIGQPDHSSFKLDRKSVRLASPPMTQMIGKPPAHLLSAWGKRRRAQHARDFPVRLNIEGPTSIRIACRTKNEALRRQGTRSYVDRTHFAFQDISIAANAAPGIVRPLQVYLPFHDKVSRSIRERKTPPGTAGGCLARVIGLVRASPSHSSPSGSLSLSDPAPAYDEIIVPLRSTWEIA
jgi:hypothetical protein